MSSGARFDELRKAAAGLRTPVRVFFRDDDADRDIPQLRSLLGLFAKHEVPLSLAVIPGTLDSSGAALLRDASRAQRVEVHQHGWMHENHEPAGRKCEFGISRNAAQQRTDITLGKERLASMLGFTPAPLFTPPWNRCTQDTCAVLSGLSFRGISTIRNAAAPSVPPGLADVSVAVDVFRWKEGPRRKQDEELSAEIVRCLASGLPAGILLHHKVMSAEDFEVTGELIAALTSSSIEFCGMEELCLLPN